MASTSLYRAYRPNTFSEVVGQEHITKVLEAQIQNKKTSHAYIFAGSRGLGKTSIARIFARELGAEGNDLFEIDAASHTGVDNIRELTAQVYTLPFSSPVKVYILDEVHMLSKGAWNAFLKTLEEPPSYAIFILATTELEKVPETVQSRCQVFTFQKPTYDALLTLLTRVSKKEGYRVSPGVLELVALLAEGSYRDALSILEKLFSVSSDRTLTLEEAERLTGAPRVSLVHEYLEGIIEKNASHALKAVRKADESGASIPLFLALVIHRVRTALLLRHAPELKEEIIKETPPDEIAFLETLKNATEGLTHNTLLLLLDAVARARFSPVPALTLEIVVYEALKQ